MPKHISGKGIAGKHTTVIDASFPVVKALLKLTDTKVTQGISKKLKGRGKRRIKFTDTTSGFKMKIVGNCYVQELFVSTPNPKEAQRVASSVFNHS